MRRTLKHLVSFPQASFTAGGLLASYVVPSIEALRELNQQTKNRRSETEANLYLDSIRFWVSTSADVANRWFYTIVADQGPAGVSIVAAATIAVFPFATSAIVASTNNSLTQARTGQSSDSAGASIGRIIVNSIPDLLLRDGNVISICADCSAAVADTAGAIVLCMVEK